MSDGKGVTLTVSDDWPDLMLSVCGHIGINQKLSRDAARLILERLPEGTALVPSVVALHAAVRLYRLINARVGIESKGTEFWELAAAVYSADVTQTPHTEIVSMVADFEES